MENKTLFFTAFKANNGQLSEIELGLRLGLEPSETQEIIAQLLSEHKIQFKDNRACEYSLNKTDGHNSKRFSEV